MNLLLFTRVDKKIFWTWIKCNKKEVNLQNFVLTGHPNFPGNNGCRVTLLKPIMSVRYRIAVTSQNPYQHIPMLNPHWQLCKYGLHLSEWGCCSSCCQDNNRWASPGKVLLLQCVTGRFIVLNVLFNLSTKNHLSLSSGGNSVITLT